MKGNKKAARTFDYPEPQVKVIREKIALSQSRFARLIGVSKRTLENWERTVTSAKALLRILDIDPEHVVKSLHGLHAYSEKKDKATAFCYRPLPTSV